MYKISMESTEIFNHVLNEKKNHQTNQTKKSVSVIMQKSKLFQLGIKTSVMCLDSWK